MGSNSKAMHWNDFGSKQALFEKQAVVKQLEKSIRANGFTSQDDLNTTLSKLDSVIAERRETLTHAGLGLIAYLESMHDSHTKIYENTYRLVVAMVNDDRRSVKTYALRLSELVVGAPVAQPQLLEKFDRTLQDFADGLAYYKTSRFGNLRQMFSDAKLKVAEDAFANKFKGAFGLFLRTEGMSKKSLSEALRGADATSLELFAYIVNTSPLVIARNELTKVRVFYLMNAAWGISAKLARGKPFELPAHKFDVEVRANKTEISPDYENVILAAQELLRHVALQYPKIDYAWYSKLISGAALRTAD